MKRWKRKVNPTYVTKKNLAKFLLGSGFGVLMFLVPIPSGKSFTTLLDFVKTWISNLLGGSLIYIVTVLLVVAAVVSLIDFYLQAGGDPQKQLSEKGRFPPRRLYLASKVIGAVTGVMVLFQVGPEVVISADTGGSIIDLCGNAAVYSGGRSALCFRF